MVKKGCKFCGVNVYPAASSNSVGGEELCIFHDPDGRKDVEYFRAMVHTKLEDGDFDFSGFVFPEGTADFKDFQFAADVNFSDATFLGAASFQAAQFEGAAADFSGARFRSGADFSGAFFKAGSVFFSKTEFSGSTADFRGASFEGETVNFVDTRFDTMADFQQARFSGRGAYFTETIFTGGADFSHCLFTSAKTAFKWTRFVCETDFDHAQFKGAEVSFQEARFSRGAARFENIQVEAGRTVFTGCRFSGGGCRFSGARISGEVINFRDADFAGEVAIFSGAEFACDRAIFNFTLFSADQVDFSAADFPEVSFQKSTISSRMIAFAGARFRGRAEFSGVQFFTEFPPDFRKTEFLGHASFRDAKFKCGIAFDDGRFLAEADFSRTSITPAGHGWQVSLQGVHFAGPFVSFDQADLRHVLFGGSSVSSELRIEKAQWPCKRYFFCLRKRFTCADELVAKDAMSHRKAADALKILKENAQRSGMSRIAGDFLFSSYECARKARRRYSARRYLDLVFGAWLSGYGQKMSNIALSAAFIILSFAFLFLMGEHLLWMTDGGDAHTNIPLWSQVAACLVRSLVAFCSAGFLDAPSATQLGKTLFKVEGMLGISLMCAFVGLSLWRTRSRA